VVLDNFISGRYENLQNASVHFTVKEGDIRYIEDLRKLPGKFDTIIHLAFPTPLCTRDHSLQFHDTAY
jgi:hypothetical protein